MGSRSLPSGLVTFVGLGRHRRCIAFLLIAFLAFAFCAQLTLAQSSEDGLRKAKKYHAILAKRPTPGYLFDRFYDAWLDHDTAQGLQAFLERQVSKEGNEAAKTADRLLLAFFHAKQGDDPLSLEQFRLALEDDPGNAAVRYEKAIVEARTLDYETAIADLTLAGEQKADAKLATKMAKLKGKL